MVSVIIPGGKLSALNVDADLAMGAYAVTINAGGLIDGMDISGIISPLTVAGFQTPTPTGTGTWPERITDGNNASAVTLDAIDEYVEIDFGSLVKITEFRYYGNAASHADARFNIKYWDAGLGIWVNAAVNLGLDTAAWSSWTNFASPFITTKIRCVDTWNVVGYLGEMEMK